MSWTWQYEDETGADVAGPTDSFSTQADAESWLGQNWKGLGESGATTAILKEGDRVEYRMSLLPPD